MEFSECTLRYAVEDLDEETTHAPPFHVGHEHLRCQKCRNAPLLKSADKSTRGANLNGPLGAFLVMRERDRQTVCAACHVTNKCICPANLLMLELSSHIQVHIDLFAYFASLYGANPVSYTHLRAHET